VRVTPPPSRASRKIATRSPPRLRTPRKYQWVSLWKAARPAATSAAGLAAFQSETHWYFLGVRSLGGERVAIFLEARDGGGVTRTLATRQATAATSLRLKIAGDEGRYAFAFDSGDGRGWQTLADDVDGTVLSTDRAGGFVGALLGPFARDERALRSK